MVVTDVLLGPHRLDAVATVMDEIAFDRRNARHRADDLALDERPKPRTHDRNHGHTLSITRTHTTDNADPRCR